MVMTNLKPKAVSTDSFASDRGLGREEDFGQGAVATEAKGGSISDLRAEAKVKLCHIDPGRAKSVKNIWRERM